MGKLMKMHITLSFSFLTLNEIRSPRTLYLLLVCVCARHLSVRRSKESTLIGQNNKKKNKH